MNNLLENKTAVVTGGSRGIGKSIVECFSAQGAQVLTCARNSENIDLPAGVHWLQVDVGQSTEIDVLAESALDVLGRVDILVNNAGIQIEKSVIDSTDEDWEQLMGVNARGVFLACRRFIPLMAKTGGGSIINIGSISGDHADPSMALYNASKACLLYTSPSPRA